MESKYNTTNLDANSFSELLQFANSSMNGGLAYGFVFVFWLISMAVLSEYPNVDTLKASSYTAWLSSVLFAVFGVVDPAFPMALFFVVAGLTAYQEVNRGG
jgi:hypothetical protein